jgi:predicted dehydrogenase
MEFFNNVYTVIVKGSEMVVKPEDALLNIRIVEAAYKSDAEKKIIQL